ncbi:CueP family metal-binding protein [Granulicoccus sp. GXG6511]|uniref:CueP family metal-binding protein n=1 Tax=Granulicoccus sp. GXG6511 TaxID=3381351 RepID=UPI003D7EED85
MKTPLLLASFATAGVLLLTGCSGTDAAQPGGSGASAPQAGTGQSTGGENAQQFLARHGLAGQSAEQIVDQLDRTNEDRHGGPVGSVRPNELVLSDDGGQVSLPLEDNFYLAFAPYLNRTHDCFNHNLASCQGELAQQTMDVKITTGAGETLVDEPMTTFDNGFIGVWLPKDITGEITVEHEGKSVTAPISTGAQDPTCVTTLQLT